MVKRLSIWFSPSLCSVDIIRATTRSHAAPDMPSVIRDLRVEDRQLLIDFCSAVLACAESNDAIALQAWVETTATV